MGIVKSVLPSMTVTLMTGCYLAYFMFAIKLFGDDEGTLKLVFKYEPFFCLNGMFALNKLIGLSNIAIDIH